MRRGKHNKSRIVVLNGWNSWVLQAVQAYADALGLTLDDQPDAVIFRGVKREKGEQYSSQGERLSARKAEDAVNSYQAELSRAIARQLHEPERALIGTVIKILGVCHQRDHPQFADAAAAGKGRIVSYLQPHTLTESCYAFKWISYF